MARPSLAAAAARAADMLPGLYAAARDAGKWPDALSAIAGLLDASQGLIFSHQATPEQRGLWVSHRASPEAMQRYVAHYHSCDIWMQRGNALNAWVPGTAVVGRDLLPDREFLASAFYREFLAPLDIRDLCAGVLHDGSEPGIPRVHIALHRSHAQPRFNAADKALLAALLSHLREATHLGFRLAEMEQALRIARSTADAILPALVMTDTAGHVVFVNRAATTLSDANDGLRLEKGRLRIAAAGLQARLDRMLLQDDARTAALQIPRPSGKPAYWLIQVDLPGTEESPPDARRASKALLIHDPANEDANLQDFAALHKLTAAETRLLGTLLRHPTLPEAARFLGVSINTVRSQLRAILDKSGARRQVELMRMVVSWPRRGIRTRSAVRGSQVCEYVRGMADASVAAPARRKHDD
ncbi:MAG: helix-turn-helix transcriptional regulator [Rhodocyclaceae bacterium]|nr:helix-turn-helix transcriptional regulator [Rhodocyclaceae bacterium]